MIRKYQNHHLMMKIETIYMWGEISAYQMVIDDMIQ